MPLVCWTWDREFKRWLHWWLSFYPQHSATYVVVPMHFQTIQILIWQVPRTFYKLWIYYTSLGSSEEVIVSNLSIIINNKYTIIDNNKLIWTFIVFWMKISLYMDRKESLLKQVTIIFRCVSISRTRHVNDSPCWKILLILRNFWVFKKDTT